MSCGCQASPMSTTGCACASKGRGASAGTSARLAYRDGQRLTVRDLRDEQARDATLRRLHVRHQHETWGIALGLGVHLDPGGLSVVVAAGHAIDAFGRDLVLGVSLRLPVPPIAGPQWMALVAQAAEGKSPGPERPLFRWRPFGEVQPGHDVPLATAKVAQGAVPGSLDLRSRRYARKLGRPRIGNGATDPGGTEWVAASSGNPGPFLTVGVSTAEAGFLARPRYFANLEPPPGVTSGPALGRPLAWIASAQADSFTFQVAAGSSPLGLDLGPEAARKAGWSVSWIGVEPSAGAEPALLGQPVALGDVSSLLALFGAGPIGGECP